MAPYLVKVTVRAGALLRQEQLTPDEIAWALAEVDRLAQLEEPWTDYTLERIEVTNGVWHRQKPEGAPFRTILSIVPETRQITVQAILRRDDDTYRKVFLLFQRWEGA